MSRMNHIVSIPVASSSDRLQALAEVSQFGFTDMGGGHGSWTYRIVPEPSIYSELAHMSAAQTTASTDSLSFQPCPQHVHRSQDRYVVQEWEMPNGQWQFNGVLDGHLNHYTVEHAVHSLPSILQSCLSALIKATPHHSASDVSKILRDSILAFDNSITTQFLDIFPRDAKHIRRLTDPEIQYHFKNSVTGPGNRRSAVRAIGGTTLLFTLTDPTKRNLWVANLGDCYSVLGVRRQGVWSPTLINSVHSCHNPSEARRVRAEHPGEANAIHGDRILGFLEPSRALGDSWLKIPAIYTSRIISNLEQDWISPRQLNERALFNLTPPYVSGVPDVYHHELPSSPSFLILCSDGLRSADVYQGLSNRDAISRWVNIVARSLSRTEGRTNAAVELLRDALGGRDVHRVSRNMTVEMEDRWMDDITILVQRL